MTMNREIKEVVKQAVVVCFTYSVYIILAGLLILKFIAYVYQ